MDKTKFRKDNGFFVRRVGPVELESCIMHVINKYGFMLRVINAPEDVVGVILDKDEPPDVPHPKVEFTYKIRKMVRKHGKPSTTGKSKLKFGLKEFAQLFADAEKTFVRRGYPLGFPLVDQTTGEEVPLTAKLNRESKCSPEEEEKKLEKAARKQWKKLSKDLCQCKKELILEQIQKERELQELLQSFLHMLMNAYDSHENMLLDQLERNGYVVALNLTAEKYAKWTLEKKDPNARLLAGKKEMWKQHFTT